MAASLDGPFVKKVWERLRDSPVPIVEPEKFARRNEIAAELSAALDEYLFLPSTIHGYLGIQKGGGVTRFLPVLNCEDMAVYYYLCYRLAPRILIQKKGIYGAWHMILETKDVSDEGEAAAFGQSYGQNPFSSRWWLKNWRQFNDLIAALIGDRSVGNYVVTTDIANFYDSIEVPRLISSIRQIAHSENDTIEALSAFLSSWNRRHIGYRPSTKGIPQEIISDASRVLSHFYLQRFDGNFSEYCDDKGLTYIRWADDFLVFGGSKQRLESAVHHCSRLLRDLGLNLNAAKTKYMSKSELRVYRCLDILAAISNDDAEGVRVELRKIKRLIAERADFRLDTVFRAMIGFLSRVPRARTAVNRAFLSEVGDSHRDLLHSLNNTQMLRFIQQMDRPFYAIEKLRSDICRADFGGPRASYLHMMRKYRSQLAAIGITKRKANHAIDQIERHSLDSDVIRNFCIPVVRQQYS